MAVFTDVTPQEAAGLLNEYDLGNFKSLHGIKAGIENSNFYLNTTKGKWVLTVFERLREDQLPFYLKLTRHLEDKGISVSAPVPTRDGRLHSNIHGKPCSIAPCIPGITEENPTVGACEEMGILLAKMHLAVKDFPLKQENTKGLNFWLESLPLLKPYIPADLFELLEKEVNYQAQLQTTPKYKALESGAVHADLFRNNSLIVVDGIDEHISGVIDFYFACNAPFLYDLAVTINDWCVNLENGKFIKEKAQALLGGYASVRPLTEKEHELWQDMLSAAALRFWVSRLYDFYLPRQASLLKPHDPSHFERILKLRRFEEPSELPWVSTE